MRETVRRVWGANGSALNEVVRSCTRRDVPRGEDASTQASGGGSCRSCDHVGRLGDLSGFLYTRLGDRSGFLYT